MIIDGGQQAFRPQEGVTRVGFPEEFITFAWENIVK